MQTERMEYYLGQATFCRDMAGRSESLERKAEWLRLACLWLSLAEGGQPGPEGLEIAAINEGSGQLAAAAFER
jgi:hypothetical protein